MKSSKTKDMKKNWLIGLLIIICQLLFSPVKAQSIQSPDGKVCVMLELTEGKPSYSVSYQGQELLKPSALGVVTNIGDYTQGLALKEMGFEHTTRGNVRLYKVSYARKS